MVECGLEFSMSGGGVDSVAVLVAEYLGQRTDVDEPVIQPRTGSAECPFMTTNCSKLRRGQYPVCSVRKNDGTLWIVCPDRLCSTLKTPDLSEHQRNMLHQLAQCFFSPTIQRSEVAVRREVRLGEYKADYIMTLVGGRSPYAGPDRLVLEMQGGGETSKTGSITRHVKQWMTQQPRTNALLRCLVDAGTIETNAWRRQQEQFLVKGSIAMKTWKGYGIAFCVGVLLYDYLTSKLQLDTLPDLRTGNWTLALVAITEDATLPKAPGPIPLAVDASRQRFTDYQTFVHALINQGKPSPNSFAGAFKTLDGRTVNIPLSKGT